MGSHQHVYLGPYVECTYRNETREVSVFGCTSPKCVEYTKRTEGSRSGKFCSTCASPLDWSAKRVPFKQSPFGVLGEDRITVVPVNDSAPKTVCLISNTSKDVPRDFHPEDECSIDLSGSTWSVHAEMSWFEERFAKDIAKLKTAYDNVTVKWGLHIYYM